MLRRTATSGGVLQDTGHFVEALIFLKRGHELGSKQSDRRYNSAEKVRDCQHLLDLSQHLPAVLSGSRRPAGGAEMLAYARLCLAKQLYVASTRLFADAFADQPNLAADLKADHRYSAACIAVRAATGQGQDAGTLTASQKAALRRQALTWLRADLTAWSRVAENGEPSLKQHLIGSVKPWQIDADLAALRDAKALQGLQAEERLACERLWADVAALLKQAGGKAK